MLFKPALERLSDTTEVLRLGATGGAHNLPLAHGAMLRSGIVGRGLPLRWVVGNGRRLAVDGKGVFCEPKEVALGRVEAPFRLIFRLPI